MQNEADECVASLAALCSISWEVAAQNRSDAERVRNIRLDIRHGVAECMEWAMDLARQREEEEEAREVADQEDDDEAFSNGPGDWERFGRSEEDHDDDDE